jgi:hypothetical protein
VTAEAVAHALGGRRSGRGWVARCVSHEDRRPSLSLADGDGGRLLVRCWAGCDSSDILRELARLGLLPPRERPTAEAAERWRREQADLADAEMWAHGARLRLDAARERLAGALRAAMEADAADAVLDGIGERLRHVEAKLAAVRTGRGSALVDLYRAARTIDPAKAAAMEREGSEDREHAEAVAACVIGALVVADTPERAA